MGSPVSPDTAARRAGFERLPDNLPHPTLRDDGREAPGVLIQMEGALLGVREAWQACQVARQEGVSQTRPCTRIFQGLADGASWVVSAIRGSVAIATTCAAIDSASTLSRGLSQAAGVAAISSGALALVQTTLERSNLQRCIAEAQQEGRCFQVIAEGTATQWMPALPQYLRSFLNQLNPSAPEELDIELIAQGIELVENISLTHPAATTDRDTLAAEIDKGMKARLVVAELNQAAAGLLLLSGSASCLSLAIPVLATTSTIWLVASVGCSAAALIYNRCRAERPSPEFEVMQHKYATNNLT